MKRKICKKVCDVHSDIGGITADQSSTIIGLRNIPKSRVVATV